VRVARTSLGDGVVTAIRDDKCRSMPSRATHEEAFSDEVRILAEVTDKPLVMMDDEVFAVRRDVFRLLGRPATQDEVISSMRAAVAAKDAALELQAEGLL
jgi:hypothetical protein